MHHVFVNVAFNHPMEKKVSDRIDTGKLLHLLLRNGVLTAEQYLNGYVCLMLKFCLHRMYDGAGVIYRRIPIVAAPVTFGFSRPNEPLLSSSRYFRMVKIRL